MLGAEINIVAPSNLMPKEIEKFGVNTFTDMKKGLKDCDIVMMLRLQNERMTSSYLSSNREYYEYYGLTPDKLDHAKSEAFIKLNQSKNKKIDVLRGKTQINLFFEPSTRTQSSFELAGKRLGADVMSMNG